MIWADCRTPSTSADSNLAPCLPPPTDRVSQPVDRIPAATNHVLTRNDKSERDLTFSGDQDEGLSGCRDVDATDAKNKC